MPRMLVIGEALIDIVKGVEIVGGSPANVALGLGRFGRAPQLLTALAPDERGWRIAAHLEESGVEVRPESFVLDRTSTARAELQPDGSAHYDFDIAWRLAEIDIDGVDAVHVGSIACFLEPGAAVVLRMLRRAAARGVRVTFDPNIRPALVGGVDVRARVEEIAALSTAVKLSDEDAAHIYPDLSLDDALAALLATGPALAVATRGGEGALLRTAHERVDIAARRTDVVDTVGAGDTFMAALILCLGEPDPLTAERLREIGEFCATSAAITVGRAGADLPTLADVERALL
ncbi:carbohydrate kinase [Microbacterium sp. 10M-3C3]|jgi:fructokinase|uniref:carbohydrate kinase family protein n=1 Tax=Microbacterium sp. 10M-3C3 TaxID=2483401 RepID=UPI000F634588|nr:carbohydrate kinase [Microbacterium sp. 10M-3C3]